MPTVDDLVISLRIDESSNLGKLQKQLKALVGDKGDKAVELGLDSDTKRDIRIIRDRIVKFTPSVLMDSNLKEGAFVIASDLKKDTALRDKLIQKHGINIARYDNLVDELVNISLGISDLNADQQKIFIAEMDKFRKLADTTKGELKTAVTRLTKMLLEKGFNRRVVAAFREAGVGAINQAKFRQITKESLGKQMDETIKRLREDDPERFAELEEIFLKNSDSLEATAIAYELQTGKILDLTKLSQEQIYDNVKLHKIIAAQASAALTKAQFMQNEFYKAGVQLFTKTGYARKGVPKIDVLLSKISQKTLKRLELEHLEGDKITDDMINILGEIKTVVGADDVDYEYDKRIVKQGHKTLILIGEEFTPPALERLRFLKQLPENKGRIIGAYKFNARAVEMLLGIASNIDDKLEQAKKALTPEEEDKENLLKSMEEANASLKADVEGVEKQTTGKIGEKDALDEDKIDDVLDALSNLKYTTDDTNKKVNEEDINEPNVEKDPTED